MITTFMGKTANDLRSMEDRAFRALIPFRGRRITVKLMVEIKAAVIKALLNSEESSPEGGYIFPYGIEGLNKVFPGLSKMVGG